MKLLAHSPHSHSLRSLSNRSFTRSALALSGLLLPFFAHADWELDATASSLYYTSSKAGAITELNTFTGLAGNIEAGGLATLNIDLASVDTAVDVRNERMQNMFFEVADYPAAEVSIDTSDLALDALAPGQTQVETLEAALTLHGVTNSVTTEVMVTGLENNGLLISSTKPLIIDANSYGLGGGLEALREIAALPSINPNALVSFSLVYREQ